MVVVLSVCWGVLVVGFYGVWVGLCFVFRGFLVGGWWRGREKKNKWVGYYFLFVCFLDFLSCLEVWV